MRRWIHGSAVISKLQNIFDHTYTNFSGYMTLTRRPMCRDRAHRKMSIRNRRWVRWYRLIAQETFGNLVYSESWIIRLCCIQTATYFAIYYVLYDSVKLIDYFYRNVVSTVNLQAELKLTYINVRTRNSEYNPARFTGLIMRIRNPRATALIFSSGKLVCTGAKSEDDSLLAARKFARIIQKLGFSVSYV